MKLLHHSHLLRAIGAASVAFMLPLGCAREAAPVRPNDPVTEKAPEVQIPQGLSQDALSRLPPAFATRALGVVPADAPWLVTVRPSALSDAFELPSLLAKHPETFDEPRTDIADFTEGLDLLDVAGLSKFGIDPTSPSGVFAPDTASGTLVFFVAVTDPAPVLERAEAMATKAGQALVREAIGSTLLVYPERHAFALLVRDGVLFIVVESGSSERTTTDVARALRAADPKASLAATADFGTAVDGLTADDAGVYIRPEKLLAEDAEEGDVEAGLALGALKGFDGLALGLDAAPDGFVLRMRPAFGDGATLPGLFGAAEGPLLAMQVIEPAALARVGMKLDLKAAADALARLLGHDGGDAPGADIAALAKVLGVDFANGLLPAMTGDIGLTISGDLTALFGAEDPEEVLGLTVVAGVSDVKAVEATMEAIAKKAKAEGAPGVKWSKGTRTLTIPTGDRREAPQLTARVEGGALIVSTFPKARISAGQATHATPKVRQVCEASGLSAAGFFELALPMAFERGGRPRAFEDVRATTPQDSPERKAKQKELAKLMAEADALRKTLHAAEGEMLLGALRPFGTVVHTMSKRPGRLEIELGLLPAGATLSQAISGFIVAQERHRATVQGPQRMRQQVVEDAIWQILGELDGPE